MVSQQIQPYGGTILSYLGDGVLIVWGAPEHQEDHALRACKAAIAIDRASQQLALEATAKGMPELRTRIGINTGAALIGNVGARDRFNYTPIGDAVNTAARIEAINKVYGTRILLGEVTVSHLNGAMKTRPIDTAKVSGKADKIQLYELIG